MGFGEVDVVRSAVVGGQEDGVAVFADFFVEIIEECFEVFVEAEVDVFYFDGIGTIFMTDVVCGCAVDGEEVGDVFLSEVVSIDCGFGEVEGQGIAEGAAADVVVVYFIEFRDVVEEDGFFLAGEESFPAGGVFCALDVGIDGVEGIPAAGNKFFGFVLCVKAGDPIG